MDKDILNQIKKIKNYNQTPNTSLDALVFSYYIESLFSSSLDNILDLTNLSVINKNTLKYKEKFLHFKIGESIIIIEFSKNYNSLSFFIYIFGVKTKRARIINTIRKHIDNQLDYERFSFVETDKQLKTNYAVRNFQYMFETNKKSISINFGKLLKLKQAGMNTYFDEESGKKIPVTDLLKYVGAENETLKREWKGENYITNLELNNFKLLKNIKINISKNINIFIGNNGSGKTSILQAITFGLLPIEYVRLNQNKFSNYISLGEEKAEIKVNWGENEYRRLYIFQKGIPEEEEAIKPPQPLLLAYGVNFNSEPEFDSFFVDKLIDGNADFYFTESIFKDYTVSFNNPLDVLYELHKINDTNTEIEAIISLSVNSINSFLELIDENERILLKNKKGHFYFEDFSKNKLDLQNLSEGYKDHVLLISDIILRIIATRKLLTNDEIIDEILLANAKGVILIDEFDRHLHPSWQQKLIPKLKETFENIQFILTTHNPFSLQSGVGATVHKIVVENKQLKIQSSKIEARNILSIISEFYTSNFFDYKTQSELNNFSSYLDKIHNGEIDLVYSTDFKQTVQKLDSLGTEIQGVITSQLLQLNSSLKKLGKKEFEL